MSIATDIEVNWIDTVDNTNKIGLSKPLNELGVNIFDGAEFVTAYNNKVLKQIKETVGYPTSNDADANDAPLYINLQNMIGYSLNGTNANGLYYRKLLFAVKASTWGWDYGTYLRSDNTEVRIVTSLDLSKNKCYLTTDSTTLSALSVNTSDIKVAESVVGSAKSGQFLVNGVYYKIVCGDIVQTENAWYVNFSPYISNMYDDWQNKGEGAEGKFAYDINDNHMFAAGPAVFDINHRQIAINGSNPSYYNVHQWDNTPLGPVQDESNPNIVLFGKYILSGGVHWRMNYNVSVEYWLLMTAGYGLYFEWNNTKYKPLISQGVVTGYTSDLSKSSDIDNWTNVSGHDISPTPPTPPTGDIKDKEHEMPLAYIGGSAGMVTFYEINKTGLASADDISEAVSRFDIAQIGKDLLRNFISFKAFAAINTTDTVDRQIKIAGVPLEDSGGHALTGRVIGGVLPIDLFSVSHGVTIPTLYNDYRDYEPYTKIQMYVPFCGWFDLPSWCIGKKITGTMFTDLYNGTVKAVIKASDTVVAEVGGCCAYDIPFVADATGMKAGAVISSALTTAAAVGGTVAMPNVATGIAAVSSAANLAATLNSNATTLKGVLGDGSNMNGLLHVYIKVSRPMSPNGSTKIPDSYKHEIGVPTMKEVTINAGDGYIQVMDAKVTGNMTAREKQMIIDGFRHGLNF